MNLTRKFLGSLGIEEDKIEQIIEVHVDTVNNLKDELATAKENAEKLPAVQKELDELKAHVAKDGKNPFEVKYTAIKEEFEKFKAEQMKKETAEKKATAYRKLLKDAGIAEKRIDSVLRVSDIDSVKLTDDGSIDGEKELMDTIKKEWSDFIQTEDTHGVKTPTPPATTAKGGMTKEEILKIKDTKARLAAISENHDLFGI